MVHVLELLGCIANGPTTEDAIAATPDAIRTYLRFIKRHGEDADPDESFATHVTEHITEGDWLGNGSPSIAFGPDLEAVSDNELETLLHRYGSMREEVAAWAERQDPASLMTAPAASGRTAHGILLHVLGPTGGYVSAAVGGTTGFSHIRTRAERGELPLADARRQSGRMLVEVVRGTTPEQRSAIIQRPAEVLTLRKGLRRTLEHDWEHLAEISRRPGGPEL